ncbi:putative GP-PDE domain-containing protein [Seiridium cardinale]
MKFGRDFQRLQLPQWKEAYINYDNLKQVAKHHPHSPDQSSKNNNLETCLTLEIDEANRFLQKQLNFFYGWIEATLSRFSLAGISLELEGLAQVAPSELQDLSGCLQEILAFVSQLEAFAEINRDAIHKLLTKSGWADACAATAGGLRLEGLLFVSPWINTAARLRDLLGLAGQARDLHQVTRSVQSLLLQRVSPMALGCSSDEVHRSIRVDDSASLMVVLASPVSYMENQAMLYSVLQVAINYRATMCIKSLLEEITSPLDDPSCGHQDALHQLIIQNLRARPDLAALDILVEIFRELSPYQHHMLLVKDWRQRYPLHYAAEQGLVKLCKQLVKFMEPAAILEADASGMTPLHLAVSAGHVAVVKSLLTPDAVPCMLSEEVTGRLLHIAVQARSADVTECLLTLGKGLNFRDKCGRTPLFNAVTQGQVETIKTLLVESVRPDLDLTEDAYGWSPLIVACVCGHLEAVKLLLQAGADVNVKDHRGWTAVDHASYRAHMTLVDALQQASHVLGLSDTHAMTPVYSRAIKPKSTQRSTSLSLDIPQQNGNTPVTSVFVNLGSFDVTSSNLILKTASCITNRPLQNVTSQLQLEASGSDCLEEPYMVSLPLLGDVSEVTWVFSTSNPDDLKLSFKLFECLDDTKSTKRLLASGIALLDSIKAWFRPGRQSLKRESTVALGTPEGGFGGSITFTHLVCHPYSAPGPPKHTQKMRASDSTQVVGHRGLGWNMAGLGRMQIGEHTVQSLQSALDHGADLIEFDVQITRDRVPVIYHDWQVSETGLDIPIHAMTYKQWMAISEAQTNSHHDTPRGRLPWDERARPKAPSRRNSKSLCPHPDHPRKAMAERMMHTIEYARNHNKGNIRGECIHDAFTTLRELFQKFPDDVNFDIELKYPMLWECPYWEMEPYWTEMNEYIDTTLDVVFELGRNRSIFFTCFNPEVCILLSTKQKTYPVVFLNDSMVSGPAGDQRAISLQQAMRFARQWGLQGIVMAAEPFVAAPKLIKHVKEHGLVCGSYGSLNDIPEHAKKQAYEGIDMLVVNNVRLISNTLRSMDR